MVRPFLFMCIVLKQEVMERGAGLNGVLPKATSRRLPAEHPLSLG